MAQFLLFYLSGSEPTDCYGGDQNMGSRTRKVLWGLVLVTLLVGLYPVKVIAGSVSIAWDPNTETDLAGYKVYVGTSPGTYTQTIDVGNVTTFTISDLTDGETYYVALTAYDIFANESGSSTEVSSTPPQAALALPDTTTSSADVGGTAQATASTSDDAGSGSDTAISADTSTSVQGTSPEGTCLRRKSCDRRNRWNWWKWWTR